ncbi:MAG: hypothetical protein JXQ90_13150 [Cyclobacteriaceae bacterium]
MKKFKTIFYIIYLVTVAVIVVMSINIYESLEVLKQWGWYKYFTDLPFIGRNLLLVLCTLMIIEMILENIALFRMRSQIGQKEKEITELKAKLYDLTNEPVPEAEEDEDSEEEESDED